VGAADAAAIVRVVALMHPRRWQCERKHAWQSEYVASNVATALGWKGWGDLEAYQCPYCALWHVGHVRGGHDPRRETANV
jgi:hypothetical protein